MDAIETFDQNRGRWKVRQSLNVFSMPLRSEWYYWPLTKGRLNLHGDRDQRGYQDSAGSGTEKGALVSSLTKGSSILLILW